MRRLLVYLLLFSFISCEYGVQRIADSPFNPLNISKTVDTESANSNRQASDNRNDSTILISINEKEVFDLINQYRKDNGLSALKWIDQGILEAQLHSEDQRASARLTHDGLSSRINSIEAIENVRALAHGENVGYNFSAQKMVNAWIKSYGHRQNILGNYTHTGIGEAKEGSRLYFTQIFLRL